jgi:hypothetical protein
VPGSGPTVAYTPRVTAITVDRVEVVVSEGSGGSATGGVNITIVPYPI